MHITEILPLAGVGAFAIVGIGILTGALKGSKNTWMITGLFGLGFLAVTIVTVIDEGLLGFWPEHVDGWWGNQIWLDLLSALLLAFFLVAPRARAQGMVLPFWFLFICCSGSIGLFAMVTRMLYLESKA